MKATIHTVQVKATIHTGGGYHTYNFRLHSLHTLDNYHNTLDCYHNTVGLPFAQLMASIHIVTATMKQFLQFRATGDGCHILS